MPPAEIEYPVLVMPETVERTTVKIWSNGVALDADLYRPKGLAEEQRLPAVVLSHGWGGSKSTGERYAAKFAAAGMVCLCFSYSGWSSSGSHVVLTGDPPDGRRMHGGKPAVRGMPGGVDPGLWEQDIPCGLRIGRGGAARRGGASVTAALWGGRRWAVGVWGGGGGGGARGAGGPGGGAGCGMGAVHEARRGRRVVGSARAK